MNKKILLLSVLFLTLLAGFTSAQEYQDWKIVAPNLQVNNLSKIQMIDANTWIAVGQSGTFMKTTNAGVNWYYHHQAGFAGTGANMGYCYGLYFFDAMTGVVTGDAGYIARTTDGGQTFTVVGAGVIPSSQRGQGIVFTDDHNGFIGAGSGSGFAGSIAKTTDAGRTWASVLPVTGQSVTAITATDSLDAFGVFMDGSVTNTTDGGLTWTTQTTVVPQACYAIGFVDQKNGIIAGNGMAITNDAGTTWTVVNAPQTEWAYHGIKIVSPTEVYLVGDPQFIWKTTDVGTTWTAIPVYVNGPADTYIWEGLDIQGSNWIICGDFGVVGRSTNSGASWYSTQHSFSTQILFDITEVPGTNHIIAVGRQWMTGIRQIVKSEDGGNTWGAYDTGINVDLQAISMVNSKVGYACGTNSTVIKTTNGGLTWIQLPNPDTLYSTLYHIKFVNETTGWIFYNYVVPATGNIIKTTDGGLTWSSQTTGTADGIQAADMLDSLTGYCTMNPSNHPIYKTTNGGINWVAVPTPFTSNIQGVSCPDKDIVYIGQSYGTKRFAKSTNGGSTWTQVALPVNVDVHSMKFINTKIGYVGGNLYTDVCRTSDGGDTWTYQNLHVPTLGPVYATPGDTAFALGTYNSIFRNVVNAITEIHTEGNSIPKNFRLEQNYPNPFNPTTRIQFSIPEQAKVKIEVYNILGRLVTTLVNENKSAGQYEVNFNGSGLASGVYIYKLTAGTQLLSRKMILIK